MAGKCLTDEEVMDYLEGRMPENDRSMVEEHLSECEECLEEVLFSRGVVRSADLSGYEPVPKGVTESAIREVRRHGSHAPFIRLKEFFSEKKREWRGSIETARAWGNLGFAAVRGEKRSVSKGLVVIKKRMPGMEVIIEIEETVHDKARIWLKVKEQRPRNRPIRVTLAREGREISSDLLNGTGALFEDLAFAHYSLIFSREGSKIGEYLFEIKESRDER